MQESQTSDVGMCSRILDAELPALKLVILDGQTARRKAIAGILVNKFVNAFVQETADLEEAVNWTFHDVDLVICALEDQGDQEMVFLRRLRSAPRNRDIPVLIFPRCQDRDRERRLAAMRAVVFHGDLVDVEDLILSVEALITRYRQGHVCHTRPRTALRRKISKPVWMRMPALGVMRQGFCVAPDQPLAAGISLVCDLGDVFQAIGLRTRGVIRECVSIGSAHGASRPMSLLYPVLPDDRLDRCLEACVENHDDPVWEFYEQRSIGIQCQMADLSASGAGLVSDIPWEVNHLVTLNLGPLRSDIPSPDIDTDIICRVARVTRQERRYGVALQFEQASTLLIDAIMKWSVGP